MPPSAMGSSCGMSDNKTAKTESDTSNTESALVSARTAHRLIFPIEECRPSFRTFNEWRSKGFYSYLKVGKRVLIDVNQVKADLAAKFTVPANH